MFNISSTRKSTVIFAHNSHKSFKAGKGYYMNGTVILSKLYLSLSYLACAELDAGGGLKLDIIKL